MIRPLLRPEAPAAHGYRIDVHLDPEVQRRDLAREVARGLRARPRALPPKLFYDPAGSALFEKITRLDEYYPTRAEAALLGSHASELMLEVSPGDLVELGSGSSTKIRRLLDCAEPGVVLRYVPMDVDEDTVRHAAAGLVRDYPLLDVYAVVGDFEQHLALLPPRRGRRLVTFFGSTIGNLHPPARQRFLSEVRHLLGPEDRLLVGLDLVKPIPLLEAAYNDAQGVTAEFNRNVLRVVNRGLGANFDPQAFRHEARFDARHSRIDMFLVAEEPQAVNVRALNLRLLLEAGEAIWTESSYKFTRARAASMLAAAGLDLERWLTDYEGRFALALAAPV